MRHIRSQLLFDVVAGSRLCHTRPIMLLILALGELSRAALKRAACMCECASAVCLLSLCYTTTYISYSI